MTRLRRRQGSRRDDRSLNATDLGHSGDGSKDIAGLVEVADQATKPHLLARGFVLGGAVAAAMAIFIVQNTASIGFKWLWLDFEARLWLVLLAAFVAGLVTGPLLLAWWRRTARREARRRRAVARFTRHSDQAERGSSTSTGDVMG